jgi:hypothetical protein
MTAPPPILRYDHLPPGSDISRSEGPAGVTITVPAGPPGAGTRSAVRQRAMVESASICGVLLAGLVGLMWMFGNIGRLGQTMLMLAVSFFTVLCGGLFLLIAHVRFTNLLDLIGRARQQATILHVQPDRLLVETSGPHGVASHDLPQASIRSISIVTASDPSDWNESLEWLQIERREGEPIRLLPGRDRVELQWIAGTIAHRMQVELKAG